MKKLTLVAYLVIFLSGLWFLFNSFEENFSILFFAFGIVLVYIGYANIKRISSKAHGNKTELENLINTAKDIFALLASVTLLAFIIFLTFQNEIKIKFFSDQGLVIEDDKKISIYFKSKEVKTLDSSKYEDISTMYSDDYVNVIFKNKDDNSSLILRCDESGCKEEKK
ncbi:hypothetical protein G9112_001651 [Campylobacter coli]|uniref:hypothetical protein n=1 Tax=Campylobacter jejuni TaxID=197 RepID=UPI0008FC89C1|nr:hypothetical protein [Campylobacter jejuni]EAI5698739.1 hypothetical protein [Campylobacter coli]EAB5349740.1 hypothetical protein [Campylobacter jejuni]EAB5365178.1 hypothetical protein [Campylobacter jejuni]EAC1364865.1 hypothetical protein [Campylobacter jejuni]EAC1373064.1 hypothetical protein [Campylobacter jejuni]